VDSPGFAADDEATLTGGNTHAEVVRIGATVRRPTGPWTPAVHSLLRYLEARGFVGVPRVLGIDERGREVLTFVPGTVVWPEHFHEVESDDALEGVARWIREYHDMVESFDVVASGPWSDRGADPTGPPELVCHNDLAPWNLIRSDLGWSFIDWDLAAPGRRSWDLAWALHTMVPLWPGSGLSDDAVVHRVRVFCSAYGIADLGPELIEVALERCVHEVGLIRVRGTDGEAPYAQLLADGHDRAWAAAAAHVAQHAAQWKRLLLIRAPRRPRCARAFWAGE
jgi:Phosphotransferase enzyme family